MSTVSCAAASRVDRGGGVEHNSGVTSPLTLRASAAAFMRRFMAAAAGRISALRTSCRRARIEIATLNLAFPAGAAGSLSTRLLFPR